MLLFQESQNCANKKTLAALAVLLTQIEVHTYNNLLSLYLFNYEPQTQSVTFLMLARPV
jgi:hypothetical protein